MGKSSFDKWLVTLALLIVIAGAILHFVKSNRAAQSQQQQRQTGVESAFSASGNGEFHPYYIPSVPRPTIPQPAQNPGFDKLPREKVEAWLAKHHRDAMSLLAAFRALNDTNYLNEAAANFPNNPQVELAVLARDEFPADRRKWLDLFKASSPSNSLANYLSAQDYLENSNTDAAVQELLAATGETQFDNYAAASELGIEALAQFCGKSPGEANRIALAGTVQESLPELAAFKRLALNIENLQEQEAAAGDTASVQNLAQIGMALGNRLIDGGSGNFIINQLVGIADERIVLSQLDPNTGYDFLGGKTPNQVSQELGQEKKSYGQVIRNFEAIYPKMTEDEIVNYVERSRSYGEIDAMKWAIQQHPPGNP
jgi:hypothetical protein